MSVAKSVRFLLLGLLIPAASVVYAQIPDGGLNGLVTDPKDAVVAGAHVAAVSTTQGISRETVTNGSGLYVLSNLPAGTYDLKIEQAGFAATEFKAIAIEAGRTSTIDAKLSSAITMSAASRATSVPPLPMATPMAASRSAGASFTPSPVIPVIS